MSPDPHFPALDVAPWMFHNRESLTYIQWRSVHGFECPAAPETLMELGVAEPVAAMCDECGEAWEAPQRPARKRPSRPVPIEVDPLMFDRPPSWLKIDGMAEAPKRWSDRTLLDLLGFDSDGWREPGVLHQVRKRLYPAWLWDRYLTRKLRQWRQAKDRR